MAMVQPKSQKARLFITHLLLLLFIAAIMFPLLMVVAISLRQGNFATGSLIPEQISWDHWKLALGFSVEQADGRITPPPFPVLLWLWNSVKVAGISAIGIVALSTTCAYAFARMRFPGKATLLKGMLIFQMFPAVLSLVALYALFDRLGEYIPFIGLNTHGGVIFAYLGGIALHVWTIKGYFETIDSSLEEAAALNDKLLPLANACFNGTKKEQMVYPTLSEIPPARESSNSNPVWQVLPCTQTHS